MSSEHLNVPTNLYIYPCSSVKFIQFKNLQDSKLYNRWRKVRWLLDKISIL